MATNGPWTKADVSRLMKLPEHIERLERRNKLLEEALRTYGSHLYDCDIEHWNEDMTECSCGLFQVLAAAALKEGQE